MVIGERALVVDPEGVDDLRLLDAFAPAAVVTPEAWDSWQAGAFQLRLDSLSAELPSLRTFSNAPDGVVELAGSEGVQRSLVPSTAGPGLFFALAGLWSSLPAAPAALDLVEWGGRIVAWSEADVPEPGAPAPTLRWRVVDGGDVLEETYLVRVDDRWLELSPPATPEGAAVVAPLSAKALVLRASLLLGHALTARHVSTAS